MENNTSETIGCDLGDKVSQIRVLDATGQVVQRASVKTTRKGMAEFFRRPGAHVVIEVGAHSRWVKELLAGLGHRVTVANARQVKLISQSDNKMDAHDAELLARLVGSTFGCWRRSSIGARRRRPTWRSPSRATCWWRHGPN